MQTEQASALDASQSFIASHLCIQSIPPPTFAARTNLMRELFVEKRLYVFLYRFHDMLSVLTGFRYFLVNNTYLLDRNWLVVTFFVVVKVPAE